MWKLKNIETGDTQDCSARPEWVGGIWECGEFRVTDVSGAAYEVVDASKSSFAKVGPIAFKLLFSSAERIAAKALRATDPVLEDFWGLLDDQRTQEVDLGLASVQAAVEYTLAAVKAAGVDLDVAARKAQILTGVVQ